jgi:uncharacterized protein (DUF4415 family)
MPAEKDTRTAKPDEIREMARQGELSADDPEASFDVPESFWERARPVGPRPKKSVHLRLDPDVLEWFRQQGPGYQTKINAVLRSFYNAHKHEGER